MKVFLTGGTGFVGSHVAQCLVAAGHEVTALVRKTSNTAFLDELGVSKVTGKLGEAKGVAQALAEADGIVHVAGVLAAFDPKWMYAVNVEGTRDLVDTAAAVATKRPRFVYISSVAAQGPATGKEPRSQEEMPRPVSIYGESKLGGEGAVLARREELPVTILRPPAVYGPRDTDMFQVFAMARWRLAPVLGGGDRWLSIIHAEDVARAVLSALQDDSERSGRIYPIDDGEAYTWRDLGRIVAEAVGTKAFTVTLPPFVFSAAARASELGGRLQGAAPTFDRDKVREMIQPSWVCGHQAIRSDLGWTPKWDLAEGSKQTARWYREQGWL